MNEAFIISPRSGRAIIAQRFIAGSRQHIDRSPQSGRQIVRLIAGSARVNFCRPFHGLGLLSTDEPSTKESVSKLIRPQNVSRRVASRLNLAGLFKARKEVCKISLVAL